MKNLNIVGVGIVLVAIVAASFLGQKKPINNPVTIVAPEKSVVPSLRVTPQQRIGWAIQKVQQLILSHPEPLVRKKLFGWLRDGSVKFAANEVLPEMSASMEQINGKSQVLLFYNVTFLLEVPGLFDPADKEAYLLLVVYHEAVHIDDHFSGRLPLGPVIPVKPMSELEMAENVWDREWSAVSAEWLFAKKIRKQHLVPVIHAATKGGDNPRAFLEGFYKLQISGNAVALNPALLEGLTSRYRQEVAKLPTR